MVQINFNATKFEHEFRLSMLKACYKNFEEQLIVLRDQSLVRARAELRSRGLKEEDEEYQVEIDVVEHKTIDQFPQILRSQFVVAIWSLIEIAINDTAKSVQTIKALPLKLGDISGSSPKDKWNKYFTHVLGCPLSIAPDHWKLLDDLRLVRNIIAHSGGVRTEMSQSNYEKVAKIAEKSSGFTVSRFDIEIEPVYINNQFDLAEKTLEKLAGVYTDAGLFS